MENVAYGAVFTRYIKKVLIYMIRIIRWYPLNYSIINMCNDLSTTPIGGGRFFTVET